MNPIFAAGLEIEQICRAAKFQFCFIGGLAVQRWGQPRMTADVDLKDWLDIRGIVDRQGAVLDRTQIWAELAPLLELRDDPTIERRLQAIFDK